MSPVRNSQPSKLLTRASTGAISNGVKRLVSRYRPRFVRSLVYMLQASEYDIRDYLAWVHRASDFAHVEKRKTLVWSTKAKTLYAAAWASIVLWVVAITGVANFTGSGMALAVDAFALLLTPFLLPYMLALLVVAGKVVQTPVEQTLIAQAKRKLRAHHAIKIAIAGSYGKTSMREILKTVLAEGKKVAAPPGSYNTPLGISKFVRGLKGDEDVLIFELGEYYPGDISKLCELVRPQWGIITGVNEAHLEKFGTLEKTASTIFELLDWLKKKPVFTRKGEHMKNGALYVNGENIQARAKAHTGAILFSREGCGTSSGGWRVENARTGIEGTSFILKQESGKAVRVSSKLLGLHMVGPLAAAADIASRIGLTAEQIERGIQKTRPFEHRLEPKQWGDGVLLLDDSYNGNPDGAAAVIDFLGSIKARRRWYVTPGLVEMGARTEEVHCAIGQQLAGAGIEKVVLIRNSVTPHIERGLKEAGYGGEILWYDDMPHALDALRSSTVNEDVVLVQNDWPDQYA